MTNQFVYIQRYKEVVQSIIENRMYFQDLYGEKDYIDGVQASQSMFTVSESPDLENLKIGDYNKDPNVGMGTGTAKSSRFGDTQEVVYQQKAIPWRYDKAMSIGLDAMTVNESMTKAIKDVTVAINERWADYISEDTAVYLDGMVKSEGQKVKIDLEDDKGILEAFDNISQHYVNKRFRGVLKAKVTPKMYNAIVNHPITTTGKHSAVSIDDNRVAHFKGIQIEQYPEDIIKTRDPNALGYVFVEGISKMVIGVEYARVVESVDYLGKKFQSALRYGFYTPEKHEEAVLRIETSGTDTP